MLFRVPRPGETLGESGPQEQPPEKKGKAGFFTKKNPANFS